MTKGVITKTGNSFAIRVPKSYIVDNKLKLGDIVNVEDPLERQQQAIAELIRHGKKHGQLKGIADPVAWQKHLRSSWEERNQDDSSRH